MVVKTRKVLEKKKTPSVVKGAVTVQIIKKKKPTREQTSVVKKIKIATNKPVLNKKKTRITLKETSKTANTKVLITDNTKRPAEIIKRVSIYPLVQSPFRFPLPSSKAVSVLANSFGMVFVLIGAFFSMVHMSENVHTASYNALSNLANIIDSSLSDSTQLLNQEPGIVTGVQDSALTTNPLPHITTTPVGDASPGIYIAVTVSLAQEVKVLLSNGTNGQLYALGAAKNVDPSTWKIYWDTSKHPAGEYRIKLLIKNLYGSYEYIDTNTIIIEDLTTYQTNLNSTDSTVQNLQNIEPLMNLKISEENPVNGSITFDASVMSATSVKITLENSQNGTLYSVGLLAKKAADLWRITWNSSLVPDGTYTIKLRAILENGTQLVNTDRKLTVRNASSAGETNAASTTVLGTEPFIEIQQPTAQIVLEDDGDLGGFANINIVTSPVDKVELFVIPQGALTPQFIGIAQKETETKWKFLWQTENTPNGEYYLFARVKSPYGTADAGKLRVRILNTSMEEFTVEEEQVMDTFRSANDALIKVTESDVSDEGGLTGDEKVAYIEPVSKFVEVIDVEEEAKVDMEKTLNAFRFVLHEKLSLLAKAKRDGDDAALRQAEADIEALRNEVLSTLPKSIEKKEIIEEISRYLSQVTFELSELTVKNETLLRERVGDAIMNDSDMDEISDYDEINLYKTNPFSADSDNDGHNDNIELVSGFDPLDSKTEAVVVYESPKEVGIVREDLLIVEAVTPIEKINEDEQPKGLISGKALPNSFVTLYIYSTPVVVTVKTDSEGNWNYIFDKELEDGEHEVYVGITNNQGKIVAKSNPLPFIKTAEAFAGVTPEVSAATIADAEPSLINTDSLLTIASMIVLILGIVLLFLGFHLKKEDVIIEQQLAV